MTKEGREYGRRKREDTDEETERRVRETIDEMKEELENRETPEKRELPEQTYCPDEAVREAIDEVVREEAERKRLKEQRESKEEEPKETKEEVKEIPQEWDVDRCVREAVNEVRQEEIERQRLREEREHEEMEKEQQREASREAREETADKDNLEDYEEEIKKGYEKHGIDPEELEERWRKKFEEEVKEELGEGKESRKETEEKEDESEGHERTAEGRNYYDDGSGQVYEVQMESKESTSAETESSTETPEVQDEPSAETEQKKEEVSEIREDKEENTEDVKQEVPEKTRNSTTTPENTVPQEVDRASEDTGKRRVESTTVDEDSVEESKADESKKEPTEQGGVKESQEAKKSEKPETREEHEDAVEESSESSPRTNRATEEVEEPLRIESSEDTSDTYENHPEYSIEVPEDFDKYIEELLEDLIADLESEKEEPEVDESRIIVDAMTGREHIDRTYEYRPYNQETEEETEEIERVNIRARLKELFGELSEEEREKLKKSIRSKLKTEEDLEEFIERNTSVRASPDYKEKLEAAKEYLRGKQRGPVPKLIKELLKDEVERVWSKFVLDRLVVVLGRKTAIDSSQTLEMNPILYSPKGSTYSVEDIRRLYYDEGLSKSEIARSLGIANSTVHRVFEKNKWKSLPAPKKGEPEQAYKLSQLGLTHKEIAERMGLSRSTVSNYLRELGVSRKLLSSSERKQRRKEKSRKVVENAKALRDKLFGTKCSICGATREKRTIAIHNKDFKEHKLNALWRVPFLQKVNPEEWAALCIMCHRGVHWVHDDLGMNWQDIENLFRNMDSDGRPQTVSSSKPRLTDLPASSKAEIDELRKKMFGEECYFCGPIPDGKNRVIHRKDGQSHKRQALWRRKFLLQMNLNEWIMLCQKHHRYVHWAMKHLGLSWKKIEKTFKKS